MLNKTHIFGVLAAAMTIAPGAALADQVMGSDTTINQFSTTVGSGNTTGQNASSSTFQNQFGNKFCGNGSQVAGANTAINQGSSTFGYGNVTGQNGSSVTDQHQSAHCFAPYFRRHR